MDHQYVSRRMGGRALLSVTEIISSEERNLSVYVASSSKRLLQLGHSSVASLVHRAFCDHFGVSICDKPWLHTPQPVIMANNVKSNSPYPPMPHFEITTQGVHNILNECNSNKSPGPNKLHPYVLKATAADISPMLTRIFPTVSQLW